jgi:hypothetical protein
MHACMRQFASWLVFVFVYYAPVSFIHTCMRRTYHIKLALIPAFIFLADIHASQGNTLYMHVCHMFACRFDMSIHCTCMYVIYACMW